jgi:hypothetical protein
MFLLFLENLFLFYINFLPSDFTISHSGVLININLGHPLMELIFKFSYCVSFFSFFMEDFLNYSLQASKTADFGGIFVCFVHCYIPK